MGSSHAGELGCAKWALLCFVTLMAAGCLGHYGKVSGLPQEGETGGRGDSAAVKGSTVLPDKIEAGSKLPSGRQLGTSALRIKSGASGAETTDDAEQTGQDPTVSRTTLKQGSVHLAKLTGPHGSEKQSEEEKARSFALELASALPQTTKIKLCRDTEEQDWLITLYEDTGSFLELKQFTWSVYQERPQPFLVVERIGKAGLDKHLKQVDHGMKCQVLDPTRSDHSVRDKSDADERRNHPATPASNRVTVHHEKKSTIGRVEFPGGDRRHRNPKATRDISTVQLRCTANRTGTMGSPAASEALSLSVTSGAQRDSQPRHPTYFVFAYGSQMNHTDLLAWLDEKGYNSSMVVNATPGVLPGYDLVWNFYSASRGGGVVNVEPKKGSKVWGLLVEIEDPLLTAFDDREGHPAVYSRGACRVPIKRATDGKTVFAWVYRAKPNSGERRDIWPTAAYKQMILEAALFWDFPQQYIRKIASWRTQ